jgi:hypothetical protein
MIFRRGIPMSKIGKPVSLAACALLGFTAGTANANAIANGSFELNPPGAASWQAVGQASIAAPGSNLATDGSHVGALGVGGAFEEASGTVYQDFTLSQAGNFSYGFDAGTVFFGGFPFGVGFTFRIDDQIITTAIPTFVSDSVSFSYYPLSMRIAGDLDLTAGTHRFAFDISRSGTLFGRGVVFVIDDIETGFVPAMAGVPEPSAWALLILGFGAVGAGLRRQRALAFA